MIVVLSGPRFVRQCVAVLLCAAPAVATQTGLRAARPHLLWIVADDLGWNDVGFMNGNEIHTPAIDSLARDGQVFTNYYVQPSCSPTRATFLTGRYPLHHGINNYLPTGATYGLPLNETTVADLLLREGYRTHAIGKWHLGAVTYYHTPTFRGFESFYGFYGGGQDYFEHSQKGVYDLRRDEGLRCGRNCSHYDTDAYGTYSTELFATEAVRLIKEHDTADPLFLYFAPQAVHGPQQVPESYLAPYDPAIPDRTRRVFAGMVSALDRAVAELLEAFGDRGMLKDTFVIFTTDNGGPSEACGVTGSSNFPLRGSKCSVWDGGTRGIAMVKGYGVKGRGTRWPGLMHAADWLPTIMSMVGSKAPVRQGFELDGIDMWPTWTQGAESPRCDLYYGVSDTQVGLHGPAYRMGDMKLIIDRDGGSIGRAPKKPSQLWAWQTHLTGADAEAEMFMRSDPRDGHFPTVNRNTSYALYNLSSDPDESDDLATQHADMAAEMVDRVKRLTAGHACMDCADSRCPEPASMQVELEMPGGLKFMGAEPFCDAVYDEEHAAIIAAAQRAEDENNHTALAGTRGERVVSSSPESEDESAVLSPSQVRPHPVPSATTDEILEKWEAIDGEAMHDKGASDAETIVAEAMGDATLGKESTEVVDESSRNIPESDSDTTMSKKLAVSSRGRSRKAHSKRDKRLERRKRGSNSDRHAEHGVGGNAGEADKNKDPSGRWRRLRRVGG